LSARRSSSATARTGSALTTSSRNPDLPLDTRLQMIRQLAEALDHAHRRHLYHRALAPRLVYVELSGRYPTLRIADWQVAARPDATTGGTPRTRPTSSTAFGGDATRSCRTSSARPAGDSDGTFPMSISESDESGSL
jgi:serine/threonine protein kinase